ncbi:MAG: LysR family transcriptional regulator [Hydrogenophaga sp.]|uniref:LysR substrate-binding domain-containing protein n=1 Tax=Hydrogenophaga sp. TaxID=1904254 RepID=UPI0025B886FA|nr:LysR substrate-binding domain-containing protein [Hydrogenophaga sp.]MBU7573366.1 LysR family transcriptional regulator [Hydrogenophaga sp.]
MRLPALHLLQAFSATARHGSISAAARDLHLTQGAVSKKLLELEASLGVALFDRIRGRLHLSPAGHRYLPGVDAALGQLEQATLGVMTLRGRGGVLNVMSTPTFGAKWLIPRLPRFLAQHPEVFLNFVPFSRGASPDPDLDCALLYGNGTWPGASSHYIAGHEYVVIAPPRLPASSRLRRPRDIALHALLQHPAEPGAWPRWCELHGVSHPALMQGPKLDQVTSIVRAVMAGMGLGLVPRCVVQDDIDAGLVAAPFSKDMVGEAGYYLTYPEGKNHLPPLATFRDWMLQEATGRDAPAT